MAAFLAVLPFIAPDPDNTTRRDRAEARALAARLSYRWTVTERIDRLNARGTALRHLVVEQQGPVAMPAFRLDRQGGTVLLSEHDDAGSWTLGRFDTMADALAALRRTAMAHFAGSGGTLDHAATA